MQPYSELGRKWHLQFVAVKQSCQGRGLCKALVEHKRELVCSF